MSEWENSKSQKVPARHEGVDQLPPHSIEAEQGVLGCILLEPNLLLEAKERFGAHQAFFDLRHYVIFEGMCRVVELGQGLDMVTLINRLRSTGQVEAIGGHAYLSSLPDATPSAGNFKHYLEIVWSKFLARKGYKDFSELASQIFHQGDVSEPMLMEIRSRVDALESERLRHQGTPKFLKRPVDFEDGFFNQFFGGLQKGEPGWSLPIEFKLKIRPGETTLVTGDDGSGKSTVLDYFALHLMHEMDVKGAGRMGETTRLKGGVCIASFEMPPAVTLWMLCSQLIGRKEVEDCQSHRAEVANAFAWLNTRAVFYDFLGIGDWRDVLSAFRFAAEKQGVQVFILDSVMRIGIADDDYATQGLAAAAFAQFAKEFDAHLFFVIHENKGAAGGKAKIRGSKLWSANADNVVRVERNMKKGEKIAQVDNDLRVAREMGGSQEDIKDLEEQLRKAFQLWDTHFVLQKQRYPGSQQNGSRHVWFDPNSFQFRERWTDEVGVNWLARWKRAKQPRVDAKDREWGVEDPTA